MRQHVVQTKIGPLYLTASEQGLRGVYWREQAVALGRSRVLTEAARQIQEYLGGNRREFDLELDPVGTEFQMRVWNELKKIPYGQTRSYSQMAKSLGMIGASRAVGTANGKNPLCLIVPCHRVIAADGSLGGFSGGLAIKRRLLEIEGISPA